ncbi:MAG: AsmA family protein [Pseudomonadota bacterium]
MNRLLLFLGSALLLTLTAALVVPRFVDWSTYTAVIEEQASRVLGREVHVSGDVDLTFLPMPRITFTDVEIASQLAGDDLPEFKVERMEALLSLAPFLSGEAHIVELRLQSPVIRLSDTTDVGLVRQGEGVDLTSVSIESAVITDGRVERISGNGEAQVLVDGLNANLSAPSLLGPWRVDPASALIDGEPVALRVNTGVYDGDRRMRMRVAVLPANRPVEAILDGHLDWSSEDVVFEGQGQARSLTIGGAAAVEPAESPGAGAGSFSWQVSGDIRATVDGLEADPIEVTIDKGLDQAFVFDGNGRVDYPASAVGGTPTFTADIISRQVDLDRMLGGGAAAPISVGSGWQASGAALRWLGALSMPGEVTFDVPAIVVGGSIIRDVGFDATYEPGSPLRLSDLHATLPGDTELEFSGTAAAAGPLNEPQLALEGHFGLESAAPALFVQWSTGRQDESLAFSQLQAFNLEGAVRAIPDETSLTGLSGTIDGQDIGASVIYRTVAGLGQHLDVDLNAGRFDFGLLSGLGRWLTQGLSRSDDVEGLEQGANAQGRLVDRLNADLSIGELVAGAENLGQVEVILAATPDQFRIEQLSVGDAVGAQVSATGFLERGSMPPMGSLAVSADMERLSGLLRVVRDLAGDHPLLVDLERNARLYEPAFLAGTYSHTQTEGLQIGVSGTLGGTQVRASGDMPPLEDGAELPTLPDALFDRATEWTLSAEADDAFALVGQLGLAALPTDLSGPGRFALNLSGDGIDAPMATLAFDGLEASVFIDGTLTGEAQNGLLGFDGAGSITVGDVAQIGLMAGMALPGIFDPIGANADFDIAYDHTAGRADISRLAGSFAGVPVQGSGMVDRDALGTNVRFDLRADRLDGPQLLAGFVGPTAFDQGFSLNWPEGPLAFNPLPFDFDLSVETPRLTLWEDIVVLNAGVDLKARETEIAVERLEGSVYGGDLDARLVLRNADPGALAEGRLQLEGIDLADLSWERRGQPVLAGQASASLTYESAGGSITSLMAGLSGDGTLAFEDVSVSGLGLDGFSRVLQASDASLIEDPQSDLTNLFADALGAGSMHVASASNPVTLVGGVAQLRNIYVEGPSTALRGSLSVDLTTTDTDADFSFAVIEGPGDVEELPNVGLSFTGPLAAPEREIDVSQVASFLSVRQLEREIRRVEALNAEILERERLLRIMGAIDLDRARIAADAQEAARLEAEQVEQERLEQQRVEEERLQREVQVQAGEQVQAEEQARREREAQEREDEQVRLEQEAREAEERERALAGTREADAVIPSTPSALDFSLPPLDPPITVPRNPLSLGESVPAATGTPLSLTPN